MEADRHVTDIETTDPTGSDDDGNRWLAGPPPPPPDERAADPTTPGPHQGERGLAAHSPLTHADRTLSASHLRAESPWMLASGGMIVALGAYWVASFVSAFQHGQYITAQERILRAFAPGQFVWVAGAVLAVALYSAGRRFEVPQAPGGPLRHALAMALVLAGAAAVASSAIGFVVELASFGHGIATAIAGLIAYLGTFVLGGALAYWANREHEETSPAHR